MKAFLSSMTGRIFLVLLLGIVASAALTHYLAVTERQRTLERYRDSYVLDRSDELISTISVVAPRRARPT